jgi:hypothetical protein
MSYRLARECFKENIQLTGGAQKDPVSFNLYNGLFQLATELENDLTDLKNRIKRIESRVSSLP